MSYSLRFLLGHVAPPPTNMEHEVGRDALTPALHTALGIERVLGAAKLVEKVEGFEAHGEHLLQERPGEGGVAHKVVGVHRRAVVAAPTVHLGVGGQLELPRQAAVDGEAIVVLVDVERGEVVAVARAVAIGKMARGREVESIDAVGEPQVLGVEEGAHGGPWRAFQQGLRRLAVRRGILHHIEVVVFLIVYARMGVEREPLLRVERAVEVGLLVEAPRRPTHVVEHLREGSRCGVVALALAHLVEGDGGAAVEREEVDLLAVDQDGAVVFQLHARHLPHEGVEHRSVGQLEGRRVVDDGVVLVGHLDAGAFHHHLAQQVGAARLSVAAAGWWVTWSYTWPQRSIFRFWADTVRAVLTMMASSKRDCFIRMLGLAPIGPTTDWGRGLGYYRFILFPLGLKPIGTVMGYANLVRV